jgi:magnesium transporter
MADGICRSDPPPEELHSLIENPANLLWLDLESPTPDELALVAGIVRWDHLTVEDLEHRAQRAKLESFEDAGYSYLVMHALDYSGEPATRRLATHEVDFVIGANYVASIHTTHLPTITESRDVTHRLEASLRHGPDYLLYVLVDRLVDTYFPVLSAMDDDVEDLEDQILADPERSLLPRIFDMRRDAVALRRTIAPQLEIFSRLVSPGFNVVQERNIVYFRDVHDHLIRIFEAADSHRDMMGGALEAYLSTVSNRMNEVMKRLTVIAALFLPITFLTGLMGMNLPINGSALWRDPTFWTLLLVMAAISVAQFVYFQRRRWV